MVRTVVVIAVVAVLVIAAAIVLFSVQGKATKNVTLYDTGAASGDVTTTNQTPPGSATPPGSNPSPAPTPAAKPIGTYAMGAIVFYTDGTDESLIGQQGFTVYRNGKAVQSLAYQGDFTAASQGVRFSAGSYGAGTGSALRITSTDAAGVVITTQDWTLTNTNPIAAGARSTIVFVQTYPDQLISASAAPGTYHLIFTVRLQPIYTANGTAAPKFFVVFPDVTVTVGTTSSPPPGGGGGGGRSYFISIVDQRVFAVYRR